MLGLCGQISSTKCSNVWVSNVPICFAACCEGGRFARCEFHGIYWHCEQDTLPLGGCFSLTSLLASAVRAYLCLGVC